MKCHKCKFHYVLPQKPPCNNCKYCPVGENDYFEPKEPRVLSAEEWVDYYTSELYNDQTFNRSDLVVSFGNGDKNGQLREWLRSEQVELRRTVGEGSLQDQMAALENLKPPMGA